MVPRSALTEVAGPVDPGGVGRPKNVAKGCGLRALVEVFVVKYRRMLGWLLLGCQWGVAQGYVDEASVAGLSIPGNQAYVNMDRGALWADLDGDGDQDLFVSGFPGQPIQVWENVGGTQFQAWPSPGVVTKGRACVAADVDNDGDLDVYVTQSWAPNLLFINQGGGTFTEEGALRGVDDGQNGFAASFGDFDRDGWVDIYVGNHTTFVSPFPMPNVLYRNNGDGTFSDVTSVAGVANAGGATFATAFCDYDEDGWPDLFVANDWHPLPGYTKNTTYRNLGNGTFLNVSSQINTDAGIQAMGVDFVDAFNDGGWDLFISNVEDGHVFHEWNSVTGAYDERAVALGVQGNQLGWAVHFFDHDNDGWQDLYVNHQLAYAGLGTNQLYRNPGSGVPWINVAPALGLGAQGNYFTSALADYDDDGRVDILQLRYWLQGQLFRNAVVGGHWLKIRAVGTKSNRAAIGARVLVTAGGMTQRQTVRTGTGFLSGSDLRLHFGLGTAVVASDVTVLWPSGQVQVLKNVAADQIIEVVEPSLSLDQVPLLGTPLTLTLRASSDAGLPWVMVLSLGTSPGIWLPDGRIVPVNLDPVAQLTSTPGNPFLQAPYGILSGQGEGQSPLFLPQHPALIGLTVFAGAVTLDPGFVAGVKTIIVPSLPMTLQ